MSSWKKASKLNQKVHRERHQPESRAHLGLLEKKKDYKFRAKDYNSKKHVLKCLRRQALNRNPDEFYFHMINSKMSDGKHIEKKKEPSEDTIEQKKLMENRNLLYVNMKRTIETRKIEKLKSELHVTDLVNQATSSHIYFSDSDDEKEEDEKLEDSDSDSDLDAVPSTFIDDSVVNMLNRKKQKRYKELTKRIARETQLNIIQRKMEIEKALKDKTASAPKLVKQGSKTKAPTYLWKYERKR